MDVREKLVELLDEVHHKPLGKEYLERLETIADYLISHGVAMQPVKIGDTVYGQFDWYGKEIHECKIVKVKVCQFRDKSLHCFLDVEFDITDPYYRDGRVMHCMQQATYGENYGTWHRVYASREEAENAMPQPPKGE
jgi:hypothetical protein